MPPAGKRKANAMLDRIEKMAKQSAFDEERKKSDKYEVERKEYFESARAMFEESEKKETKEQYFDRLLKESTSLDKVLEFLKFRKQADKLLPNLREEMIKLVKNKRKCGKKGKQRRDTREQTFEDKTRKVLRSRNNKIAHGKKN